MLLALALCGSLLAPAGSSWITVDDDGPADFADLAAAVAAAQPGDTLLVYSGSYGEIAIGSGLEIVGARGLASPADPSGSGEIEIAGIVVGQTPTDSRVRLVGLTVRNDNESGVFVDRAGGVVWIEDCRIESNANSAPLSTGGTSPLAKGALRVQEANNVVVANSELVGSFDMLQTQSGSGQPGLLAQGARVTLIDTLVAGGNGFDLDEGGDGALLAGAELLAIRCSFEGGDGGDGSWTSFLGGNAPGAGGHGIHAVVGLLEYGPSLVQRIESPVSGGVGGSCLCPFSPGAPGQPILDEIASTILDLALPARTVTAPTLTALPGTLSLEIEGAPGDMAFGFLSLDPLATWTFPLAFDGPLLVNTPWSVLPLGLLDGLGQAAVDLPLPSLPGFVETYYLQSVHLSASGTYAAGGGTSTTLLGL